MGTGLGGAGFVEASGDDAELASAILHGRGDGIVGLSAPGTGASAFFSAPASASASSFSSSSSALALPGDPLAVLTAPLPLGPPPSVAAAAAATSARLASSYTAAGATDAEADDAAEFWALFAVAKEQVAAVHEAGARLDLAVRLATTTATTTSAAAPAGGGV